MQLQERIEVFARLGEVLRESLGGRPSEYTRELNSLIENQERKNPWFTPVNVRMAVEAIAGTLNRDNLTGWTNSYPELQRDIKPVKVAVIMAGNVPLVGFHDFLTVLMTGNYLIAKTSSRDDDLIRFFGKVISELNPEFKERIVFTTGQLSGFDAVIATGSDNTSRYFEYYFGKYPHIIRKNRNGVAVIDGGESENELTSLGTDIFSYFGLGCRNVSKVYIPDNYDLTQMTKCWRGFSGLINHTKYANNYDFNKAVFLVNREEFVDTGFLLIKENRGISSPVSVLYLEEYSSADKLHASLSENEDKIQCITGRNYIPFGSAQQPALWDYADKIDTVVFLLKKISAGIL